MPAHLPAHDHDVMDPAPARYAIRIHGHLGATVLSAFPAMLSQRQGADPVLTGRCCMACWLRSRRSASTWSRFASSHGTGNHQDQVTAAHRDGH